MNFLFVSLKNLFLSKFSQMNSILIEVFIMALSHYGVLENVCPTYEERLHTVGYAELFMLKQSIAACGVQWS